MTMAQCEVIDQQSRLRIAQENLAWYRRNNMTDRARGAALKVGQELDRLWGIMNRAGLA